MKELFDIIAAQEAAVSAGMKTVLATVVKVEGSSYRKEGARMLVREDGSLTGAISGGCLEGDAMRKALMVMSEGAPVLLTYDSMDEDDARLGVQLGCNGIVHILLEPVRAGDPCNPVCLLRKACGKRETAVLATLFSLDDRHAPHPGTCLLLREGEEFFCERLPAGLAHSLMKESKAQLQAGQQAAKKIGEWTALLDLLEPPVSLLVVGAGNDAQPLMSMSALLGWQSTVVDGRSSHANPLRFPEAANVIVGKPADVFEQLRFDRRTVAVMMTHNYNYEMALLPLLLKTDLPYIGLLGPRRKRQRMIDELGEGGIRFTAAALEKLHGPTGLDIGAQTAEEIALSILAEIKAVLSRTNGTPLRDKRTAIHADWQTKATN